MDIIEYKIRSLDSDKNWEILPVVATSINETKAIDITLRYLDKKYSGLNQIRWNFFECGQGHYIW